MWQEFWLLCLKLSLVHGRQSITICQKINILRGPFSGGSGAGTWRRKPLLWKPSAQSPSYTGLRAKHRTHWGLSYHSYSFSYPESQEASQNHHRPHPGCLGFWVSPRGLSHTQTPASSLYASPLPGSPPMGPYSWNCPTCFFLPVAGWGREGRGGGTWCSPFRKSGTTLLAG